MGMTMLSWTILFHLQILVSESHQSLLAGPPVRCMRMDSLWNSGYPVEPRNSVVTGQNIWGNIVKGYFSLCSFFPSSTSRGLDTLLNTSKSFPTSISAQVTEVGSPTSALKDRIRSLLTISGYEEILEENTSLYSDAFLCLFFYIMRNYNHRESLFEFFLTPQSIVIIKKLSFFILTQRRCDYFMKIQYICPQGFI